MTTIEARRTGTARRSRPDARGRSSTRTRQEQQKQDSRQRILDAAKRALVDLPYAVMAVEDITAEAQVSRTTFYRHFEGKFAIFRELHQPFLASLYGVYDGLALHADPTVEQIRDWVRSFLDFYRSEVILVGAFWQIYSIEPDFNPIAEDIIDTICRRLAPTLPAFRAAVSGDPNAMMAKIEAHLLLQDINFFGVEVVVRRWSLDTDKAISVVARRIHAFLQDYGTAA